jgi:hypothetical protein
MLPLDTGAADHEHGSPSSYKAQNCCSARPNHSGHYGAVAGKKKGRGAAAPKSTSTRQRLKLMWDYGAFPVWAEGGPFGWQGMVRSEQLPVSTRLREELQQWSDEWTAAMWGEAGPDSKKWKAPSKETLSAWDSKGRLLLGRLRDELGQEFVVGYMDEKTGEVEWPDSA